MPIYDYSCKNCGISENVWAKIAEEIIPCPHCGEPAWRLISAPNIQCDLEPRWEENIAHPDKAPHGSYVTSRQHRDKLCKEYGLHITK
jgi:putative FmdB family regulatory protein